MNKETVGLVVSLGLLFVGYFWASSYYGAKNPVAIPTVVATVASSPLSTATPVGVTAAPLPAQEIPLASPADLFLTNSTVELQFGQLGGCVADARLPAFKEKLGSDKPVSVFTNYQLCKAFGFKVGMTDLRETLSRVKKISDTKLELSQTAGALEVVRTFELKEGYQAHLSVEVRNPSLAEQQSSVQFEIGARSESNGAGGVFSGHPLEGRGVAYFANDKVERVALPFKSDPEPKVLVSAVSIKPLWISSGSMHFLSAVLPAGNEPLNFTARGLGAVIAKDAQSPRDQDVVEAWVERPVKLAPNATAKFEYDLYMGPKLKRELDKFEGKELSKAIDFGFFSVIAWPLFYALDYIHMLVRNWGVAIIILTIIVRMMLYPLARKGYISMKKMQKVQPEVKALQEKYKDDKQKLNQEMMALMAQKGANPLSGCLPILPQLPIFFGLYSVFQQTFELRQAPFFFWIRDLSVKDPYYVLPITIAALYYLQQKMAPVTPGVDPVQQKMMQILPFVFSLMMITFPSGLALYICTTTILSILQQWYMMRKYKDV